MGREGRQKEGTEGRGRQEMKRNKGEREARDEWKEGGKQKEGIERRGYRRKEMNGREGGEGRGNIMDTNMECTMSVCT